MNFRVGIVVVLLYVWLFLFCILVGYVDRIVVLQ